LAKVIPNLKPSHASHTSTSPALLRMDGIRKWFGPTRALEEVSLDVHRGEVLALIGENGAGKSTLMKVLSGVHRADAGTIHLEGREFNPAGPNDAREAGIAMIYQELNLAPDLSVEDNIMLGQEQHRCGVLDRRRQRRRVREALELLGHSELKPRALVGSLSIGLQQLVEIARALVFDVKVIVFDEPTSSLPGVDVERLFAVIGKLRNSGMGIVYISHFLEEIREVADTYSVLRDGQTAAAGSLSGVTDGEIVSLMVGRTVDELFPSVPHAILEEVLEVHDLSGQTIPKRVSFALRRGEILGIAGLVGAGRTELLRCLFGLNPVVAGVVKVAAQSVGATPAARIRAGLGLVSEDRKNEGLAQELSINDNVTLSRLRPYGWGPVLNLRKRQARVADWMRRLQIKARGAEQEVQELSGGNQQKVALARVMHQEADVLLLDEPTKGIDVGTKSEVYRLIGELAASGKAIIFVSSYLPELLAVCDRIGVMARGQLSDVRPADQWTEESVMACAIRGDG
jgi:ribose transport system ATP-binding protein